jgi:hypothetical protein
LDAGELARRKRRRWKKRSNKSAHFSCDMNSSREDNGWKVARKSCKRRGERRF